MSGLNFFPSRTVSLYMVKMFLIRTFAILAGLVLVLQSLDLLSEASKITGVPGNGDAEVWRYIGLRAPQIISTFLPFSVLLGTILTLYQLNQNSEIISMKAAGLSAHQVLAPLVVAGLGVALLSFAFNDRIVTRANATLDAWKKVEYAPVPVDSGNRSNIWVLDGVSLIDVDQLHGRGETAQLTGITVYERDTKRRLVSIVSAPSGRRDGNGWRIEGARRFDVASGKNTDLGSLHIGEGVRPDQFTLSHVDGDELSFMQLAQAIDDLDAAGRPTKALEGTLLSVLSSLASARV